MNWFTTHDLLKRNGPFASIPFIMAPEYLVWCIMALIATGVGIYFLIKYQTAKRVKIVLITLWAILVGIEIVKVIVNISGGDFSLAWDLPLYICSIPLYIMPVAIWGKGIYQQIACAYICTIGLFGTIMNYVVPTVTVNYSLFSFYGFHTSLFHTILWVIPLVMLCTGYCKFNLKEFGWQFLGFVVITLPVLIFDHITTTNYMYFREGVNGVSIFEDLAATVGYVAWPFILYAGFALIMILMELAAIGISKLVTLTKTNAKTKQ